MALYAREITGRGQKVETSLLEASIALQTSRVAEYLAIGISPEPMGSSDPRIAPSEAFKTLDGKYISVSVTREELWPRFCSALERRTKS